MATKVLKMLIAAVAFVTPAAAPAVTLAGVLGATAVVTAGCGGAEDGGDQEDGNEQDDENGDQQDGDDGGGGED